MTAFEGAIVVLLMVLTVMVARLMRGTGSTGPATSGGDGVAAAPRRTVPEAQAAAARIIARAEDTARDLRADAEAARAEALQLREEATRSAGRAWADLDDQRGEIAERESRLVRREARLDEAEARLRSQQEHVNAAMGEATRAKAHADELREALERRIAEVAGLTPAEAERLAMESATERVRAKVALTRRNLERQALESAEATARGVIVGAIQRMAAVQTAEQTVAVVALPNEGMKGRIIGREGRNVRGFEQAAGVNLIIDDTPEVVLISCFDPIRREVARIALEALVEDGRIHPTRIEEEISRAQEVVAAGAMEAATQALEEAGVASVHPGLLEYLGKLAFRSSYGQNVLRHCVESAHLAGLMAGELGLDPTLARRCAFLHDIGKAVSHDVQGTHAKLGAQLARKFGESPEVVHAIEAHHGEVEPVSIEAVLTQAADAISGARPGARRESLQTYVDRLAALEELATSVPGVDRAFALQAGREVRVLVQPDRIDDEGAERIAGELAERIEERFTYAGEVKVTVIRERRAHSFAR